MSVTSAEEAAAIAAGVAASAIWVVSAPLALALPRLEVKTLIWVASWAAVVVAAVAAAFTVMLVVSDAVRADESEDTAAAARIFVVSVGVIVAVAVTAAAN